MLKIPADNVETARVTFGAFNFFVSIKIDGIKRTNVSSKLRSILLSVPTIDRIYLPIKTKLLTEFGFFFPNVLNNVIVFLPNAISKKFLHNEKTHWEIKEVEKEDRKTEGKTQKLREKSIGMSLTSTSSMVGRLSFLIDFFRFFFFFFVRWHNVCKSSCSKGRSLYVRKPFLLYARWYVNA